MIRLWRLMLLAIALMVQTMSCDAAGSGNEKEHIRSLHDTVPGEERSRYESLTDADYELVAKELQVEVAAIKAVVKIEAGAGCKGFWKPGVPVINFSSQLFARYKRNNPGGDKNWKNPSGLTGYGLRQWTQFSNARRVSMRGAILGTYWGMFQIGGFNYKLCGCETPEEMEMLMSESELEQLQLFATFLINTGMVKDLRAKNWSAFARKYNGASYARRGYHTKLASAYSQYKSENKK